jgi:hypothetical protein
MQTRNVSGAVAAASPTSLTVRSLGDRGGRPGPGCDARSLSARARQRRVSAHQPLVDVLTKPSGPRARTACQPRLLFHRTPVEIDSADLAAAELVGIEGRGRGTYKSGWNDRPRFAGRRLRHGSGRPVAQSYKRKEPVVKKNIRFIGLDVHAETIAVAVAEANGEARSLGVIPNRPQAVRRLVKKLGPAESLQVCSAHRAGPS